MWMGMEREGGGQGLPEEVSEVGVDEVVGKGLGADFVAVLEAAAVDEDEDWGGLVGGVGRAGWFVDVELLALVRAVAVGGFGGGFYGGGVGAEEGREGLDGGHEGGVDGGGEGGEAVHAVGWEVERDRRIDQLGPGVLGILAGGLKGLGMAESAEQSSADAPGDGGQYLNVQRMSDEHLSEHMLEHDGGRHKPGRRRIEWLGFLRAADVEKSWHAKNELLSDRRRTSAPDMNSNGVHDQARTVYQCISYPTTQSHFWCSYIH